MDFSQYIGYPIDIVKQNFDKLGIKYQVVESSDIQKNFDTKLVTQIKQNKDGSLIVVTDNFLLYI